MDIAGRIAAEKGDLEDEFGVSVTTKDIVSAHEGHAWAGSVDVPMEDAPTINIDLYDQGDVITIRWDQQSSSPQSRKAESPKGAMKKLRSLLQRMTSSNDEPRYGTWAREQELIRAERRSW